MADPRSSFPPSKVEVYSNHNGPRGISCQNSSAPALNRMSLRVAFVLYDAARSGSRRQTQLLRSMPTTFVFTKILYHQPLNLVFESTNLIHKIARLIGGDANTDNRPTDTTSAAKSNLGRYVDVFHQVSDEPVH